MWCFPLNRIWHDAVVLANGGTNCFGGCRIAGFISGISALHQDNQLLGVFAFHGERRNRVRAYVASCFLVGAFNVLWVVVTPCNNTEVLQTAGGVELADPGAAEVAGGHALVTVVGALSRPAAW